MIYANASVLSRMELFGETPSRLFNKLCPGTPQLLDAELFLYHVPGMDAFGKISVCFYT